MSLESDEEFQRLRRGIDSKIIWPTKFNAKYFIFVICLMAALFLVGYFLESLGLLSADGIPKF